MTCPDWRSLADHRDLEPQAWDEALHHFDGCRHCRDEALAVEPTLMFRHLPAPKVDRDEITAMKQAVATLRRQSEDLPRLEALEIEGPGQGPKRPAVAMTWLRAAAVAAVLITAGLMQGAATPPGLTGSGAGEAMALVADAQIADARVADARVADAQIADTRGADAGGPLASLWSDSALEEMPLVETTDPSYGSVVQVVDDEISLVVVLPSDV